MNRKITRPSNARFLRQKGDVLQTFNDDGGIFYRGHHQDMDPVIEHVRYLNDKVNSAPTAGNKNGWAYIGSIPETMLFDWLQENNYTMHQWATIPEVKDRFKRWFFDRDRSKLHVKGVGHRRYAT